jgi:diguanylate cyclase (GGDEF)-like protein
MSIDLATRRAGTFGRRLRAGLADRLWRVFLVIGLALTAGYFLLPSVVLRDLGYQLPGTVAVLAVVAGVVIHRPRDRRPWLVLAIGLALTSAGDWTWVVLDHVAGPEPIPSIADILYLGGEGFIAMAVLLLVRGRVRGGDGASLLDALIVSVGIGMLSWVFLVAPIVAQPGRSIGENSVAVAYPLLDVVLVGGLVRVLLAPGRRVVAVQLFLGGLVAFVVADYAYAVLVLNNVYRTGQIIDAGWMLGPALWGASALHPSMRRIAEPVEVGEVRLSGWRLLLLAGAWLMAPAVLVIEWVNGQVIDIPIIASGSVVLFLLVILRMGGVVRELRTTLHQRRDLERELERRALHDPLTGLANRVLFFDRLEHALAKRGEQVAVLFLDLDDFKTVNDAFGHAAGDRVLGAVAAAIRGAIRPGDTAARLGGDEFAVLLDQESDVYQAGLVAGRLLVAVRTPISVGGHQHSIGASIGISHGASGGTGETLMREADIAMYVAKGQGKDRFTVFDLTTHEPMVRGLELRADLELAIADHQFEVLYEPILDLATGVIVGVEALARWRHPARGLLEPIEFIPLAESTGAIVPLGRWVLNEACRVAARWSTQERGHGPGQEPAPGTSAGWSTRFMSVNLSPVQLLDPGFADDVASILRSSGLPPAQLVLEMTETTRLDQDAAATTLRQLRTLGTRLAIDDFGTGYASLSQLTRIPFDIVKIDQSFVAALAPGSRAESLIGGIIDLARRLNVAVVAEGIEDADQLRRLRELGCSMGQGFHFAHPMSATALAALLKGAGSSGASAVSSPVRRSLLRNAFRPPVT